MSSSNPNSTSATNIFTLAADGSSQLLPTLQANPSLASSQDSTGYSLLHALASWNHLALLRSVVSEFPIPSNLKDEDGETALFVVESVAAAQCLVEDVHVDWRIRNNEGLTAEEKIRGEGDYVAVADYLAEVRKLQRGEDNDGKIGASGQSGGHPPPLPPGVLLEVGTMAPEEQELEPDPEFKRRIEELAAREDFQSEEGQAELKQLVKEAVRGVSNGDKDVRRKFE